MNNNYRSIIIDPGHGGIDVGFSDENNSEKNFNLEISKYIYNRLKEMGFPVYITRTDDSTISNYERYEYINNIVEDKGNVLVVSIHINNENENGISIIRSIKSDLNTNKEFYDKLSNISEVTIKTLVNDDSKDYYAIQRVVPEGSNVIVIEYGYGDLDDVNSEINHLGEEIVDVIVSFFNDVNFNNLGYDSYVVEKGDYLYKIAKKYNTTVEELKKINSLGTDFLSIGQILKVPKMKENIYVVQKGDSLYSIAKKYNTTVDKIKDINNLISNKIIVNQKILIPD